METKNNSKQAPKTENSSEPSLVYLPFYLTGLCCGKIANSLEEEEIIKTKRNKNRSSGTKNTEKKGKGKAQDKRKTEKKKRSVIVRFTRAISTGVKTTIDAISKNPGVQASTHSIKMKVKSGMAEIHGTYPEVKRNVNNIMTLLKTKKLSPKRIAIDGVPGCGKSTLAKALAKKLDFEVKTLDYIDMNKPLDFSEDKTIYEHHRLLRTQSIEIFDAIIYIDEPIELSKKKCIHRKRGGINIDVFDYEKLKKIGEKAFDTANGKTYNTPNSYIKVKIRPKIGYKATENLHEELKKKKKKTIGRGKEELLFLSVYGRAQKGLSAYVNFGAYNKEILEGLSAGISTFFSSS